MTWVVWACLKEVSADSISDVKIVATTQQELALTDIATHDKNASPDIAIISTSTDDSIQKDNDLNDKIEVAIA